MAHFGTEQESGGKLGALRDAHATFLGRGGGFALVEFRLGFRRAGGGAGKDVHGQFLIAVLGFDAIAQLA